MPVGECLATWGTVAQARPVDAPEEHDVVGVAGERLVLRPDDEPEPRGPRGDLGGGLLRAPLRGPVARRDLGLDVVARGHHGAAGGPVAARVRRRAERGEEPDQGRPDVAEDDVAPERVGLVVRAGHPVEVDREPERDERPDPPEVLALDEPERLAVVERGEPVAGRVEVQPGPRLGRVPDEGPERPLARRGADELRGDGEPRGAVVDAERGRRERLRGQRVRAHPGPLGGKREPAAGLAGHLAGADLGGRDADPRRGVMVALVVDVGGVVYVGGVRHRDRGLPRSW